MAHQYSVEIHNFITQHLQKTEQELEAETAESGVRHSRLKGRREELLFFRDLLTRKYDLENRKYY